MSGQAALVHKHLRAHIALKSLDVTKTMNSSHVNTHVTQLCELPAANVTRVLGVRMLWSLRSGDPVSHVVVSADR